MTNSINTTTMTDLELAIMKSSMNYKNRDDQLCDNYSNYDAELIAKILKTTPQAIGGATSSLINKNYMFEDEGMVWITEDGVNAYFDLIEA